MHHLHLRRHLQIKRNADTQLYTLLFVSLFLLYPILSSFRFIEYPALFSLLILLNISCLCVAYLVGKYILEFKKAAFIYFVLFVFLLLPLELVIYNRATDTGSIAFFFQNVFAPYQYYPDFILYNWAEMWLSFIVLFSPAAIICARASYKMHRYPAILNQFRLSSRTKEIKYFSIKNKTPGELVMFFILLFVCVLIILLAPFVLVLVAIVSFYLQGAELLVRFIFNFHDDYIRILKRFYNKAQAYITDRLFTVLKKDKRAPILWIRSFNDDKLDAVKEKESDRR